jgi:hypothetical protein
MRRASARQRIGGVEAFLKEYLSPEDHRSSSVYGDHSEWWGVNKTRSPFQAQSTDMKKNRFLINGL